jgi:hypothetical protein
VTSHGTRPPNPGWSLARDAWGRLVFTDALGTQSLGVEPFRAFPLSEPDRWIAIVDPDGHELALIEDPESLSPTTRTLIGQELASREFVPCITRIDEISGESGLREWKVDTDRGPAQFRIESDDQIRRLGPNRLIITDVQGLRYLIQDVAALDARSRSLLDRYA